MGLVLIGDAGDCVQLDLVHRIALAELVDGAGSTTHSLIHANEVQLSENWVQTAIAFPIDAVLVRGSRQLNCIGILVQKSQGGAHRFP